MEIQRKTRGIRDEHGFGEYLSKSGIKDAGNRNVGIETEMNIFLFFGCAFIGIACKSDWV